MKKRFALESMRKLKHGAIAIALTTAVIAVVVVLNIVFSALAYSNNWHIDLTKEKIYGLTDEGRTLLDTIDPNTEIQVHFCAQFDELEAGYYSKMVFELVKQIAAEYDNITYDYIDIQRNPSLTIKYKNSGGDTKVSRNSVIVESGTEFRVFTLEAMFMIDPQKNSPWAFNGEKKLISAMVACTLAETPIAYFTTGHGEEVSNKYGQASSNPLDSNLAELLGDAGYEVRTINLKTEEISEDARLIVISNPIYDFEDTVNVGTATTGSEAKSEIGKIRDFLANFGNLIVTIPPSRNLPKLEEFLETKGIIFEDATLTDPTHYIQNNPHALVGEYSMDQTTPGGQLVSSLTALSEPPRAIVYDARPIKLDNNNDCQVSAAILTSKSAQKISADGTSAQTGQYPLVAVSLDERTIDNQHYRSYVFAVGSKYFDFTDFFTPSFGNSDVIYTMVIAMGKKQVPIDLDFKVFEDNSLKILSTEAWKWSAVLTLTVPVVISAIGVVVWIRRKHA